MPLLLARSRAARVSLGALVVAALALVVLPLVAPTGAHAVVRSRDGSLCVDAAHRGYKARAIENSLGSMRAAVFRHADYLEMDVQMTRDGTFVLMHDATIDRTTNGRGRISNMTWAQLSQVRLDDGQHVPSLASVLAMARPSTTGVLIELKWIPRSRFAQLKRRLDEFGVSRVMVNSFSPYVTLTFHQMFPDVRTALDLNRPISVARARTYGGVMPDYRSSSLTWLAQLKAAGVATYLWKVDTPQAWQRYRGRVTMVVTDQSATYARWRSVSC